MVVNLNRVFPCVLLFCIVFIPVRIRIKVLHIINYNNDQIRASQNKKKYQILKKSKFYIIFADDVRFGITQISYVIVPSLIINLIFC